jgi:hypothetical protein
MLNGVNIRDLNGVEASTSQFPLIGYTVFWRLQGFASAIPIWSGRRKRWVSRSICPIRRRHV